MKVIFMGTPEFAVPTLKALINSAHEVIAVYTKAPSAGGPNMQVNKSPIYLIAAENKLKIFTPKNFRARGDIEDFLSLNADIVVVAAYGLILTKEILYSTPHGCINIHPSNLPRWRGAAPLQRTIMAGDKDSALCIMKMDEGLDTGDIILKKEVKLDDTVTFPQLHDQMAELGASSVLEALNLITAGKMIAYKQPETGVTYAPKLAATEERISWDQEVRLVHAQIRALSTKPGAYFIHNGDIIKIITADYQYVEHTEQPGTVMDDNLMIACLTGVIKPLLLQRPGKKMIYTDAFLRGYKIPKGSLLS